MKLFEQKYSIVLILQNICLYLSAYEDFCQWSNRNLRSCVLLPSYAMGPLQYFGGKVFWSEIKIIFEVLHTKNLIMFSLDVSVTNDDFDRRSNTIYATP